MTARFTSFAPLRHRDFTLTLTSSFVSSIGTWMQSVGMGVWLTYTTHNPTWLGLMMLTTWLPAIVGSPLGGYIADRGHRQTWIRACNAMMAAGATLLATLALTHLLTPTEAVLIGLVEGFFGSSSWAAYQGLLPDLVGDDEVLAAISLSSAQFNFGRIIGPTLAAGALAIGSPGLCFALNAASFVFVVVIFSIVRAPDHVPSPGEESFVASVRSAMAATRRVPSVRRALLLVSVFSFVVSPFISLIPSMAIDVLHAGKSATSWMVFSQGVGAVLAALVLPHVAARTTRVAVLVGSALVLTVSDLAYGVSPSLLVASLILVILGGAYLGLLTNLNAIVQMNAPRALRARIVSFYTTMLSVWYPLGTFAQAALAHHFGLRHVTVVSGAVGLLCALYLVVHPTFAASLAEEKAESGLAE